ncbi:MAG TPA: hypothetical protein VF294_04235, partial [Polyangiaceae bacterium]
MTAPEYCPDDLFARARAGSISVRDQEQLDRHIAGCNECRALLLVSRGFEQRVPAQAGDTQLLARMVDRVRAARAPVATVASTESENRSEMPSLAGRRRSRLGVLLLAAALTAGVATAAKGPATRSFVERLVGSKVTRPAPAAAPVAKPTLVARALPAESAATQPPAAPAPSAPLPTAPAATS